MSNLKPAPLFLTPQVSRGCLGIGHPKRVAVLDVKTLDQIATEAKSTECKAGGDSLLRSQQGGELSSSPHPALLAIVSDKGDDD